MNIRDFLRKRISGDVVSIKTVWSGKPAKSDASISIADRETTTNVSAVIPRGTRIYVHLPTTFAGSHVIRKNGVLLENHQNGYFTHAFLANKDVKITLTYKGSSGTFTGPYEGDITMPAEREE